MTKYYSEMDAGEQREWLARQIAFGSIGSEEAHRKIRALARRIHKAPEQVQREIYQDSTAIRERD